MNRLSILINPETRKTLMHWKNCRGRSITESIRKAVALWFLLRQATKDGEEIIVKRPDGSQSKLLVKFD